MVENYCEFCKDDGTLCCNKAVQLVISWIDKRCFSVCKKHKYSSTETFQVINLKKFTPKEKNGGVRG